MRFFLFAMFCFFTQTNFAQTDNFQGKLVYQLSIDVTTEVNMLNQNIIRQAKELIDAIDSVFYYIKESQVRAESIGAEAVHCYQFVPSENLIYEYRKGNDYVLIYPSDYEIFPVEENDDSITYDSTITIINGLACKSFTVSSGFDKNIYYYSEALRLEMSIFKNPLNLLNVHGEEGYIFVKTITITPFFTIEQELINIKFYDVPMEVFQLPKMGKTHKKMQKMMRGTEVKVKEIR